MKFSEFIELAGIRFWVSYRNTIEFFRVISKFYKNKTFRKVDIYLLRSYLLKNPYRIAKQFSIKKGEKEIYTYGETPLTTVEFIAEMCGLKKDDVVYELGSGRGRACFWLNSFIGCKVVGIENIPEFVDIARRVQRRYDLKNISFNLGDILKQDYTKASVIYFYGTCSDSEFIKKLIKKLKTVPPSAKIITVSYPLSDYSNSNTFEVVKVFPAQFTWGEANVYLQMKKK